MKKNIFNIPAGTPFIDTLAKGILEQYGLDPINLTKITVFLPNRRSCRALQEAFLRASGGKPLLLPKMFPLGDIDEDEILLGNSEITEIPSVISPIEQRLLLIPLIETWQKKAIKQADEKITLSQAAYLAIELSSFLSEIEKEQLSFENLKSIVPNDLSQHWQITLNFLEILIKEWPKILKEKNALDYTQHRNLILQLKAKNLLDNPPDGPIIAAGSTGSMPATAELLKAIASLQNGSVILSGLDNYIDHQSWEKLDESHPQFGLKKLLEFLDVKKESVLSWPYCKESSHRRNLLISELMRPSATSFSWGNQKISPQELENIEYISTKNLQEEAACIALMLKEVLTQKGKTAALITNEPLLARHVAAILEKWNVQIDYSAGYELGNTPQAIFLRLLGKMAIEKGTRPISLLNLFKHPFACGGLQSHEFRKKSRTLEIKYLRGVQNYTEFDNFIDKVKTDDEDLYNWLRTISGMISPLINIFKKPKISFNKTLTKHIKIAEELATNPEKSGDKILWSGPEGEKLKEFLDELLTATKNSFNEIDPADYPGLLDAMLAGNTYRPTYGAHPRVSILSPIEARLLSFDTVILGELNEGSWPVSSKADPWMSRPMRKNFGLPLPERRIGQSAHDFAQLFCQKHIVLTRCEKLSGTQTIPSRWILRLETLLKKWEMEKSIEPKKPWLKWTEQLSEVEISLPYEPPAPKPPLSARPRKLSVTSIEKLMRDPYAIYANKILKLKKLEQIDKESGGAEFGQFVHHAIEIFLKDYEEIAHGDYYNYLMTCGQKVLFQQKTKPATIAFWWPKFERIAKWFIQNEEATRSQGIKVMSEQKGSFNIGDFTLEARADRIEIDKNNNIKIIDYKTGIVPTKKEIAAGLSPQMTLEALIADNGGFGFAGETEELSYWKMSGRQKPVEQEKRDKHYDETKFGIEELVNIFNDEKTPYLPCPDPETEPDYNDFEHLERKKEWGE